ncbi:MAG: ABC transporter permease [Bacteroidota bacterium]
MKRYQAYLQAEWLKQKSISWILIPLAGPFIFHILLWIAFANFGGSSFAYSTYTTSSRGLWGLLIGPFTVFLIVLNTFSLEGSKRTFEYLFSLPDQRMWFVPVKITLLIAQLVLHLLAYLLSWLLALGLLADADTPSLLTLFPSQLLAVLTSFLSFAALLTLQFTLSLLFPKALHALGVGLLGIVIGYLFINTQKLEFWIYTLPLYNLQNDPPFLYSFIIPLITIVLLIFVGIQKTRRIEEYEV